MTQRALELIARADVILYDRLMPATALDGARPGAELRLRRQVARRQVDVRRRRSTSCSWSTAAPARTVVRLKGGDPFVFGRGGEEAEALAAAGDRVRGRARGHGRGRRARVRGHPGDPSRRGVGGRVRDRARGSRPRTRARSTGRRSPRFPGTLVFYMGVRRLAEIAARLIDAGRSRPTSRPRSSSAARCPGQRTVTAPLGEIAEAAAEAVEAARGHASSAPSRGCATASPGSSGGRCTAAASWSRAPARRRAGSRPRCATSAPR